MPVIKAGVAQVGMGATTGVVSVEVDGRADTVDGEVAEVAGRADMVDGTVAAVSAEAMAKAADGIDGRSVARNESNKLEGELIGGDPSRDS